ncbi:hypothetical protein [Chryseobacterium sp.]|uniref:hypothetical protein n=1 Tax=Chryseobacterium sp. TaxID=1871047 RepID=UPI000ECE8EBA|nr:hypothetical protein [Chryseobacterium sp.]HCA06942.1 hypothetical protein [Chryseobacterium sp.]
MKKIKITLVILFTISGSVVYSQVGINTKSPLASFHIDGAKDNPEILPLPSISEANDAVITSTGSIGIGTVIPDVSSALEIKSSNKGFLPPRVTLTSSSDATTIPNPATGLVVYNNGNINLEPGLYYNIGTPSVPNWNKSGGTIITETEGSITYKSPIQPLNNRPILNAGEFQFQILRSGGNEYAAIQYTGSGTRDYNAFIIEGWNSNGRYTTAGTGRADNTFRIISGSTDIGSNNEINIIRIYDTISKKVYRYETNLLVISGNTHVSQLVEVY